MPLFAFVARVALALRNDFKVKIFVPVSKARFVLAIPGSATATLFTICVTMLDRKSTRLNSSHVKISYAVFCLKKKKPRQRFSRNRHTTYSRLNFVTHYRKNVHH